MLKFQERLKLERKYNGFGHGDKLEPIDLPTIQQQQQQNEADSEVSTLHCCYGIYVL